MLQRPFTGSIDEIGGKKSMVIMMTGGKVFSENLNEWNSRFEMQSNPNIQTTLSHAETKLIHTLQARKSITPMRFQSILNYDIVHKSASSNFKRLDQM